jgi:soluble lytic murein transglycosylase-like protein
MELEPDNVSLASIQEVDAQFAASWQENPLSSLYTKTISKEKVLALAKKYGSFIQNSSKEFGISPEFALAFLATESGDLGLKETDILGPIITKEGANKGTSAKGLMQISDATAKDIAARLGLPSNYNIMDPATNIKMGIKYISMLQKKYPQWDSNKIIAAYNAGPGDVINGKAFTYSETRGYLNRMAVYTDMLAQEKAATGRPFGAIPTGNP